MTTKHIGPGHLLTLAILIFALDGFLLASRPDVFEGMKAAAGDSLDSILQISRRPNFPDATGIFNKKGYAIAEEATPLSDRFAAVKEKANGPKKDEQKSAPGQIIVKFRSVSDADAAKDLRSSSAQVGRALGKYKVNKGEKVFKKASSGQLAKFAKFTAPIDQSQTAALIAELRKDPSIESVEPNYVAQATWVPNDTYYASSGAWGQTFGDMWGLQKINAAQAWDTSKGAGVVVAVVDTGVDYTHPDMKGNMWQNPNEICGNGIDDDNDGYIDDCNGWNFVSNGADVMDDFGHGTHVAGTIAATGDNGVGVIGVAPSAKIMALKSLDQNGSGYSDWLANAIYFAADHGAKVINASWGGAGAAPQIFIDAIAYAKSKGATFVAAAGNSAADVGSADGGFFPANVQDAIAVSAVNSADQRAYFSNYGAKIDVAAPGGGDTGSVVAPERSILSLMSSHGSPAMSGDGKLVVGGSYIRQAGTSMAAPHVSGVAALVLAAHPGFTPEQVRQALRASADDIDTAGFDMNSGYGRINAARAVADPAPLEAFVNDPGMGETFVGKSSMTITGRAAGTGFSSYSLDYALGKAPGATATWKSITASNSPVKDAALATWDLSTVPDGIYTIRLSAKNADGKTYEYRTLVTIDNIFITSPAPKAVLDWGNPYFTPVSKGQSVQIMGTVSPALFSNYSIRLKNSGGAYVGSGSVTLTNGGTSKVANGTIGSIDTSGLADDYYTIELTVSAGGVSYIRTASIFVDSTLRAGWPKSGFIQWSSTSGPIAWYNAPQDYLTAADLLGNGKKEIVIGWLDKLHAYTADGSELPGFPITVNDPNSPSDIFSGISFGPAIGDLDGDGKPEIAAIAGVSMFIWHGDGRPMAGWPKVLGLKDSVSIDDINGDGKNEIVTMYGGHVESYDLSGKKIFDSCLGSNFTGEPCNWPVGPVATADLNGDGKKDFIYRFTLSSPGNVYVMDGATGKTMSGWPKSTDSKSGVNTAADDSNPVVGDINGDGKLEVVVGGMEGKVFAYDANGNLLPGWPQQVASGRAYTPALGDIDGDGVDDVVVGSTYSTGDNSGYQNYDYLYAWKGDGTPVPGYPVRSLFSACKGTINVWGSRGAIIADINGDKRADVIAAHDVNGCAPHAVQAFDSNGMQVVGFPKMTSSWTLSGQNSPVVADMNGDDKLQMAWMDFNGYLYLWDLPGADTGILPWPMFQHDPGHTARKDPSASNGIGTSTPAVKVTPILTITKEGSGSGDVIGTPNVGTSSMYCGTVCVKTILPFDSTFVAMSLTPLPASGSVFIGWKGACTGTAKCSVTMSTSTAVTAVFDSSSATSTPSPSPTSASTPTATVTPTQTPASTPAPSATPTQTPTSTSLPMPTPTLRPSATPTPSPTATPITTPTSTQTPTPSQTATPTPVPTPIPTPIPGPLTITIISPADGGTVGARGNQKIQAIASDPNGIRSISIYLDYVLIGTCPNVASCSANWNLGKTDLGLHTIKVDAYNTFGAANTASISVRQ